MTKQDLMLTCLMEECSEVIKNASKCIRFGRLHTNPSTGKTNTQELTEELNDVYAIILKLQAMGVIEDYQNQDKAEAKLEKLNCYEVIDEERIN